jgi:hypothetical protein
LKSKSRAPHHPAGRAVLEVEEAIMAMRKELEEAGLDAGPASMALRLRAVRTLPPTLCEWLTRQPAATLAEFPSPYGQDDRLTVRAR